MVTEAERIGLDSVWTMENHHLRDGVTTAAVTLARTVNLKVVMGTLSPSFRHPVEIGLSTASLVRVFPGRCALNLGAGMAETLARLGLPVDHPVGRMREAIEIIRLMFAGERFAFSGRFYEVQKHHLSGDRLEMPDLFVSCMGPKLIALAGEVADGVNLPFSSPEYTHQSAATFAEGSARGERERTRQVISAEVLVQVFEHPEELSGVRRLLGFHFASEHFKKVVAPSGLTLDHEAIRQAFLDRDFGRLELLLPTDVMTNFCAVGSVDQIIERLKVYVTAGADMILLYTAGTPEQRMRTMKELAPAFKDAMG
ncbi:MAG: LLM class flavin-dependent oxidoreductase [Candidatus Dormibacteria bacterium]